MYLFLLKKIAKASHIFSIEMVTYNKILTFEILTMDGWLVVLGLMAL